VSGPVDHLTCALRTESPILIYGCTQLFPVLVRLERAIGAFEPIDLRRASEEDDSEAVRSRIARDVDRGGPVVLLVGGLVPEAVRALFVELVQGRLAVPFSSVRRLSKKQRIIVVSAGASVDPRLFRALPVVVAAEDALEHTKDVRAASR
jgi:hypothetical protein